MSDEDSLTDLLAKAKQKAEAEAKAFATTNTSARPGHVKRGVPKLDKNDSNPQTVTIKGILMVRQSMALSATTALKVVMDLLRAPTAEELKLRDSPVTEMKLRVPWFSAGGVRFAHEAQIGRDQVVAKDFQWGEDNLSRHLDEFRSTLIAQALAFLFCSKLSISPEKFHYVQTQIFCARQSDLPRHVVKHYSVERFIKGEFLKFNSNGGYLNPSYEMAQAFSHYSFHVCDGRLMVLDIQGFFDTDTEEYLLTDPVIVTDDYELLPTATNLGKGAMMDFLKVHKCGPLCQALGILTSGSRDHTKKELDTIKQQALSFQQQHTSAQQHFAFLTHRHVALQQERFQHLVHEHIDHLQAIFSSDAAKVLLHKHQALQRDIFAQFTTETQQLVTTITSSGRQTSNMTEGFHRGQIIQRENVIHRQLGADFQRLKQLTEEELDRQELEKLIFDQLSRSRLMKEALPILFEHGVTKESFFLLKESDFRDMRIKIGPMRQLLQIIEQETVHRHNLSARSDISSRPRSPGHTPRTDGVPPIPLSASALIHRYGQQQQQQLQQTKPPDDVMSFAAAESEVSENGGSFKPQTHSTDQSF